MSNFNIINSRSLKHGRLYERVAIEQFENMYDIKVNRCGLFVSEDRPYLAATPDGIISNDRIIEVKCPYASCNKSINELNVPYLFRNPDDGNLNLKHSHDYYYQVQGQLYCTGCKVCIFIVYTFKGIEIIPIPFDQDFVTEMLKHLDNFYMNHFKMAVVNKFLYKNINNFDFCD